MPITIDTMLATSSRAMETLNIRAWAGFRSRLRSPTPNAVQVSADAKVGQIPVYVAVDPTQFRRWLDLMGLQRHIKVLGIFCRLWYRDGKAGYLGDLPRTLDYLREVSGRYVELSALARFLEERVTGELARANARSAERVRAGAGP